MKRIIKPQKLAEMLEFFNEGYETNWKKVLKTRKSGEHGEVVFRKIPFHSLCEHHGLPFHGECTIAYLPNGKLLGLARFLQLVEALSHRMQIQEKLTREIAEKLQKYVRPKGVAVFMKGTHFCTVISSGKTTDMETAFFTGDYEKSEGRKNAFLIRAGKRGK
ncbi:GTP cyclohydrolase I [Candidatus Micrarchaeota archaeon]|nr:GTP cyclohydrolase I [Candidatus Micrarchaeota archaeon]